MPSMSDYRCGVMVKKRNKPPGGGLSHQDLSYIAADPRPLAVAIDPLTPDPHNARLHEEKNCQAVAHSLKLNGQLKPITVDVDGVILTGNCT